MRVVLGKMRKAISDYRMIKPGDKIAVGLSGGKDSMILLEALFRLREFMGIDFQLAAITIDPCFGGKPTDFSQTETYCKSRGIEYTIARSDIGEIVFNIRKEKNPCSLCSKIRRGMLHNIVNEIGFNKLALGHHRDDVVETFVMNLFNEGRIGCFQPVTYLSRKKITMIRPMLYLREKDVVRSIKKLGLPIIQSSCPVDKTTAREQTKQWIRKTERFEVDHLSDKLFVAISKSDLRGWKKPKEGEVFEDEDGTVWGDL